MAYEGMPPSVAGATIVTLDGGVQVWVPTEMLEALAAIEHDRWAHWQKYLHGVCERSADGALVIPPEFVARWERQMNTPYPELSPSEQDSDRKIVAMSLRELRAAVFGHLY